MATNSVAGTATSSSLESCITSTTGSGCCAMSRRSTSGSHVGEIGTCPAATVMDTLPGLPVGAAHLFSREVLILAARPTSDSSEVDHVTTPLQHQAGSACFTSRLSEPRLAWVRFSVLCCLIEILILFTYYLLRLWFVFYH